MELILKSYSWSRDKSVAVCGCFYAAGKWCVGESALSYFADVVDEHDLVSRLAGINGQFAVVINSSSLCAIAIDFTRLYPLYYSDDGKISDDPYLLPHGNTMSELAIAHYDASGAVQAGLTLFADIKQLKPSHYIVFGKTTEQKEYAHYYCTKKEEQQVELSKAIDVFDNVFKRLCVFVGNRQIVVPLTAGNDSRLIACMLKKNGCTNVLCYTVGKPQSKEIKVAQHTAHTLGFRYEHIDVSDSEGLKLCYSDKQRFTAYTRFIGGYTNFMWLYDYVAIQKLQQKGLIDDDAIFMPGHSADSIAGSHLSKANVYPNDSALSLTRKILYISNEYQYNKSLYKPVLNYFQDMLSHGVSSYSAYNNYIIVERHAQNIINSARVFKFFNYEIIMPFWDTDIIEMFRKLPYQQLKNCSLYMQFVQRLFDDFGIGEAQKTEHINSRIIIAKRFFKRCVPLQIGYSKAHVFTDLGEGELCQPMLKQLIDNGVFVFKREGLNANQIMKEWYLMQVSGKNSNGN